MYDKTQINKLINLTEMLFNKSTLLAGDINGDDPAIVGLLAVRLSQIYSIRMGIDAISTSANIYTRDFDRLFKSFDALYNAMYYGLLFNDEIKCDVSAELAAIQTEYDQLNKKLAEGR